MYLTQAGIDHINSQFGNTYELTQGSSSASFIITDAATGTLSGGSKTYDGKSASSSYTQPKFTATDSTGKTIGTMDLSAGDYRFETDGSNAGSYKIKLTTAGIKAIKAKYPNYTFNDLDTVEATYTITPATGAIITLEGGSKIYDGFNVSHDTYFTPSLTITDANGKSIATIVLQAGQYDVKNDDSAVGLYEITVNPNEIKKIQNQYSNYDLSGLSTISSEYIILAKKTSFIHNTRFTQYWVRRSNS
nr:MBG domain-containing protein [Lentilactobacillus otakiensis]